MGRVVYVIEAYLDGEVNLDKAGESTILIFTISSLFTGTIHSEIHQQEFHRLNKAYLPQNITLLIRIAIIADDKDAFRKFAIINNYFYLKRMCTVSKLNITYMYVLNADGECIILTV